MATEIYWVGHACVIIKHKDRELIIDPYISGNKNASDLPSGFRPDGIVVTHGHHDHFGDALALSHEFDCPIVAVPELAEYCEKDGARTARMNFGGIIDVGPFRIECVPAVHSSSVGAERRYAGNPCGVVVEIGGARLYHAGDTSLYSDMSLIPRFGPIDVAMLPIGGRFTMGPEDALRAVDLIGARHVVPIHFNTFPLIAQDGGGFLDRVDRDTSARGLRVTAGQWIPVPEQL